MNLKLAKMLRRMAKDAHAGMEEKAEVGTYLQHQKSGVIINARNSVRGIYRRLKKEPRVIQYARSFIIEARKAPRVL